ncbi:hypothetical protein [Bradyrhizobium valentinum]|nr:hypothetical protein [Bradyrhizobium valentinum]
MSSVAAKDIDYDKIDYSQFAQSERKSLAKCFLDMLAVVQRHKLRNELTDFLEAGCQAEMRAVESELGRHPPPGLDGMSEELRGRVLGPMFIGPMETAAIEIYKDQKASFCTGDACVFDAYRKCIMLQAADDIVRRLKPTEFENQLKVKCKVSEIAARATLTNDFLGVQRLQREPELSEKTRELIDGVIKEIRQASIISYAEDLVKVQPGRKSCKIPIEMCGKTECISLDDVPKSQREYECAIQN